MPTEYVCSIIEQFTLLRPKLTTTIVRKAKYVTVKILAWCTYEKKNSTKCPSEKLTTAYFEKHERFNYLLYYQSAVSFVFFLNNQEGRYLMYSRSYESWVKIGLKEDKERVLTKA